MQQIGRFQITRELGRGGMGIVYEAIDPVIGRRVAVKTIRVDTAAETAFLLDRLFREARSAGALAHPGIVVIFDVGRDGDLAYIAMERVDGPTLEALLESQPMPPHAMTLDILRQTADALDHAHESRIVHRDIKPANIMLHKGKTVKVTDFGIAKIQDTQHKSSQIMGTPNYMSPEHITGKPVDGRSDQFALGVIAFQMLTGAMPFPGDDVGTLVYQIVHEDRPAATKANPKLRSGLDPVLQRALAKDPKDRYRTCGEFVAALSTALTGTQLEPIPIPTPAPTPLPVPQPQPAVVPRRSKAPLWYAAGAVAAVTLGWFGYAAFNAGQGKRTDDRKTESEKKTEPPAGHKEGDTKVNPKDNLTYVWIPPGDFQMGCSTGDNECYPDEQPSHPVTLTKGYWIGRTEVTQAAYQSVIGSNPSNFKGDGNRPVEQVNWNEAKAYCLAVNMRLPTEAEWEYAARGGSPSLAARYGPIDKVAWYDGNSGNTTHPVAQKQKNGYGLFDMLGNVWEWTADYFDEKYYASSPRNDPAGPSSGQSRTLRGGSWGGSPRSARVSCRAGREPEDHVVSFGLRCAGD
jgi:formylglycine-generating enzyme required for sulfatase activity